MARVAQPLQQLDAALLRQRLATGDADVADALPGDFGEDVVDRPPLAAVEGVRGIAVLAAQRAAGQAHEDRGPARLAGLALQRKEDFGDLEAFRGGGRLAGNALESGVHGAIVTCGPRVAPPERPAGWAYLLPN